jgi:hypothetical protein
MANLLRGRPSGNRQTIVEETSPPAIHATSYGGAAAGSGGKRFRNIDDDDAPLVMQEMPIFNVSKWKLQEWRSGIPSYDDKEDASQALRDALKDYEVAEWSTSNYHFRRVYDFASKHHQQVKCLTTKACEMCKAAGPSFSFKGDANKKILPIALYVEVMKTFSPIIDDFDTDVFYTNDPAAIDCCKDCVMLEENHDCFLDGNYEMRYCHKCYPELSEAIEQFESFLKKSFRSPDSSSVADYKRKKTEIKEEFTGLLRKIAIMSQFDWVLHIHSNKHTGRRQIDVPAEVDNLQTSVGEVKKQIMQLEVVLKHQMNDMVEKVKRHAPPHRHLLEAETEQFVAKLLDPTSQFGKLTKNLSTLFGKDGKADFFEKMTKIFEDVVTNMELPIAPEDATVSKVFIQGKLTEIRDYLTEFVNDHIAKLLDPTKDFGKLTKNLSTLFGKDGKADFFEKMTKIVEDAVTDMECPIAADDMTAIQGKVTEIRDYLTEFVNTNVVPSLRGISTRVAAIDHIQKNLEAFFHVKDFLKDVAPAKGTLFSEVMELLIRKILKEFTDDIDRKFDKEFQGLADDCEAVEKKLDAVSPRLEGLETKLDTIDKKLDAVLAQMSKSQ